MFVFNNMTLPQDHVFFDIIGQGFGCLLHRWRLIMAYFCLCRSLLLFGQSLAHDAKFLSTIKDQFRFFSRNCS